MPANNTRRPIGLDIQRGCLLSCGRLYWFRDLK
jgi:hypothetical protein